MSNVCFIEKCDLVHLAWMWRMDGPTYENEHPDHHFRCLSDGNGMLLDRSELPEKGSLRHVLSATSHELEGI